MGAESRAGRKVRQVGTAPGAAAINNKGLPLSLQHVARGIDTLDNRSAQRECDAQFERKSFRAASIPQPDGRSGATAQDRPIPDTSVDLVDAGGVDNDGCNGGSTERDAFADGHLGDKPANVHAKGQAAGGNTAGGWDGGFGHGDVARIISWRGFRCGHKCGQEIGRSPAGSLLE